MQVHLELREQWPQQEPHRVEGEGAEPAEEGVQAKNGQAQRKGNPQPRERNGKVQLLVGQVKIMARKGKRRRLTKEPKKRNKKLPRSDA